VGGFPVRGLTKPTHGEPAAPRRRTYIRRRGRMTRAQARALSELAPRYCVTPEALGDPVALFGRAAPLGLEIGFGMGQGLVAWARQRPDWNLLGAEVYEPGIGATLLGLAREGLDNVRLVDAPAEALLEEGVAPGCLDEVRIFFPDPWPKKRHHKRRLLQPDFAALLAERLAPGGLLWVATDWEPYAEWIVAVLDGEAGLEREAAPRVTEPGAAAGPAADAVADSGADPVEDRPRTRFEARGLKLGHRVWDLRYRRKR
jgi:tRNA (guanine-N7-)-methyltransferase